MKARQAAEELAILKAFAMEVKDMIGGRTRIGRSEVETSVLPVIRPQGRGNRIGGARTRF